MRIQGKFDIKSTPHPNDEPSAAIGAGRMTFHKTFHGDLAGTSRVEMIGMMNKDLGSGGYVALEKVTATIAGRSGVFSLQHSSTMRRGKPQQSILVVPDSGTDGLSGIDGSMTIDIEAGGQHHYTFDYTLPSPG